MNRKQTVNPVTLASLALLTLGLSAGVAKAETNSIIVTRGPGGAAVIVNKVPLDAKVIHPNTGNQEFPQLTQRGPNGAVQLVTPKKDARQAFLFHPDR